MASSGKKAANWSPKEDEKLLDLLIEQRAQGSIKFEWSVIRALLKNQGIHKDATQIKNHYNDLGKKLKAWEFLIGRTGVGVDPTTGALVVDDDSWAAFLHQFGGKFKSFRTREPQHLEKLKIAFHGKYATGEMSFSPAMVASGSNVNEKMKGLQVNPVEHVGDSDDGDSGGTPDQSEGIAPAESHSPPKTTSCARKRKSSGGMSSDGKRQMLGDWEAKDEVKRALDILKQREEARQGPTLFKQVQERLRCHHLFCDKNPRFIWSVLRKIVDISEEQLFLDLDEDLIPAYIESLGFDI